ncbi:hypothetical protein Bca4012_026550 [Brassica carinata]
MKYFSMKFSNLKFIKPYKYLSVKNVATKDDLCLGLYSWAHNLLPLVRVCNKKHCCIPQSMDLVLQLAEG